MTKFTKYLAKFLYLSWIALGLFLIIYGGMLQINKDKLAQELMYKCDKHTLAKNTVSLASAVLLLFGLIFVVVSAMWEREMKENEKDTG